MSDQHDDDDKGAADELKEGLKHLFSAARKLAKNAEPTVNRSFDNAERLLGKLGRGGEAVANEMGREVAAIATRVADRLRNATEREEASAAGGAERPSQPAPAAAPEEERAREGDEPPRGDQS